MGGLLHLTAKSATAKRASGAVSFSRQGKPSLLKVCPNLDTPPTIFDKVPKKLPKQEFLLSRLGRELSGNPQSGNFPLWWKAANAATSQTAILYRDDNVTSHVTFTTRPAAVPLLSVLAVPHLRIYPEFYLSGAAHI